MEENELVHTGLIYYVHVIIIPGSRAHVLCEYWPQLVSESSDYFVQHVGRCGDNSRVGSDRANTVNHSKEVYNITLDLGHWKFAGNIHLTFIQVLSIANFL